LLVKVFFATDIHGSEVCWRKFLNSAAFYKADLVVLGGDVTGKVMVPITELGGGHWTVVLGGETVRMDSKEELAEVVRQIRNLPS
jgi:Icc-related predicted phosphoesterase